MTDRPQDLIVLGAPGSGKSTQAERLGERLGAVHLNPGKLFRQIAAEDSPLAEQVREPMAQGNLVPDDVTDRVVRERLSALPADQRFVLEGYPRNSAQAEALQRTLAELGRPRPAVVRLDMPRDELLQRLRGRRHLEGRGDDTEEAIARRLAIHDAESAPLERALSDWSDVVTVSGDQPVAAVTEEAMEKLGAS